MRAALVATAVALGVAAFLTLRGAPQPLGPTPVLVELFTSQG
jgi:hypothetical protein